MSEQTDMDVAEILDAAADYIRTYGRVRCNMGLDGGPRCAVGAIRSVLQSETEFKKANDVCDEFKRVMGEQLMYWADHMARGQRHLATQLNEAAARLRCSP